MKLQYNQAYASKQNCKSSHQLKGKKNCLIVKHSISRVIMRVRQPTNLVKGESIIKIVITVIITRQSIANLAEEELDTITVLTLLKLSTSCSVNLKNIY